MKRFILLLFMIYSSLVIFAQHQFDLTREKSGHYYITAQICGKKAEVMLESGIPAFLIGRSFYEQAMKECGLTFQPSNDKIRLMANTYSIGMKANGHIGFGDARYEGPIWILEDFDDLRVPVQYLKSAEQGLSTVTLNLPEGWMRIGETPDMAEGSVFKLVFDKSTGCPAIQTEICITTPDGITPLAGELDIDFGNPMLLALFKTNKKFSKAIKSGKITLNDARNKEGRIVAQGVYADELQILSKKYQKLSILAQPRWGNKKTLGLIGLPFFQSQVFLDFENHRMIVK